MCINTRKRRWDVTSAYSPIGESHARFPRTRTPKPAYYFFLFSTVCLSLEGFFKGFCNSQFIPSSLSTCLHAYFIRAFTASISGYVGRGFKRNRRTDAAGKVHAAVAEAANAAVHVPNASAAAIEVARRQRPPISIRSIFL